MNVTQKDITDGIVLIFVQFPYADTELLLFGILFRASSDNRYAAKDESL